MYMAVVLPAAVVAMPTITLNAWTAFVPVVNVDAAHQGALPARGQRRAGVPHAASRPRSTPRWPSPAPCTSSTARRCWSASDRRCARSSSARRRRPARPTPGFALTAFAVAARDRVLRQPVAARLADPPGCCCCCSTAASCCRRSAWCALFGFDCAAHARLCAGRRPRPSAWPSCSAPPRGSSPAASCRGCCRRPSR